MITTNEQIFAAIYDYKFAKAMQLRAFQQFGANSRENFMAMTDLINAESVILRNGLQVEAGIKFANVWD